MLVVTVDLDHMVDEMLLLKARIIILACLNHPYRDMEMSNARAIGRGLMHYIFLSTYTIYRRDPRVCVKLTASQAVKFKHSDVGR
jgi:hypothetical protein